MIAQPLFKKPAVATGGYQRPADWIAMPTITSTEEKVAALFLVGDHDSNFVAFRCSGAYTVDWGDGTTENVASNTTAEHNYVFSDLSASTEFGPAGSKSRQAMIVITPQSGQNLTAISFNYRHSALSTIYTTPILEILLSAPNCTSLAIGNTTGNLRLLEQCTILSCNITSMFGMFTGCTSLQSVPLFDTSSVTNWTSAFSKCDSLKEVPLFDTSGATTMQNCFRDCMSLSSIPVFDTSSVTNFNGMFFGCRSITQAPALDTSSGVDFGAMFYQCYSLKRLPTYNTSSATSMASMFFYCYSLQTIPALDCSSSNNMGNFARDCFGLKRCEATGIKRTTWFNATLGPDELNEIYTNLADLTGLTGQTITVTGNYGTASDDPSIATAKNWTVTG